MSEQLQEEEDLNVRVANRRGHKYESNYKKRA